MAQNDDLDELEAADMLDHAVIDCNAGRLEDPEDWCRRLRRTDPADISLVATVCKLVAAAEDWKVAAREVALDGEPQDGRSGGLGRDTVELALITNQSHADACAGAPLSNPKLPTSLGRYEIVDWLGSGAMGDVYRARDPQLGRVVAVKVPRLEHDASRRWSFTKRFLREARTAAAVRHEHVCPIYDAGEQDGTPYVVMAYVEGESLASRLKRIVRFDDARLAVVLVVQIAEALQSVHHHNIIHRDLKPGNILLDASGQALLTDFGLVRSLDDREGLTGEGAIVGTLAYMSPEQALAAPETLGPSADLYGLGMVLYEALAGQLPFSGNVVSVLLHKATHTAPTSLSVFRPDLAPGLVALVQKSVNHDPNQRFATASEMAAAFRDWLADSGGNPASGGACEDALVADLTGRSPENFAARRIPLGRYWPALLASGAVAALLLTVAIGQPWKSLGSAPGPGGFGASASPTAETASTPPRMELTGNLEVRFWSNPGGGIAGAPLRIDSDGAVPLRNGDGVSIEVRLNRPAYVYLVWIDSDGEPAPLYPWDTPKSEAGWDAPLLHWALSPTTEIRCPQAADTYLEAGGKPGVQHILLLARSTPLEPPGQLKTILGSLSPSPLSNLRELASLEWSRAGDSHLRSFVGGKTVRVDFPTFEVLKERLQNHFELVKVWRFAQTEH